ncbi:MAG: sulfite exporter TauE/SafE family protein [Ignavibacteria bacterium]
MTIELILVLFIIGIATGILSGMFGVGGGIIIVPSLIGVYSFIHFDSPYLVHIAIATSLFTIIFTSLSSSHKHFKLGNVDLKAALIIGVLSSVTVYLFSIIAIALPGETLKKIFSGVLIIVAIKMLLEKEKTKSENNNESGESKPLNKYICGFIGIFTGAIAAFSGLGGGVFVVPLIHYLMKYPFKKAIGTSSAAILLTAAAGVLSYFLNTPKDANTMPYSFGMVDVVSAIPIVAASIPFARLGVYINRKTHHHLLSRLFALFILIVSIKMIFF